MGFYAAFCSSEVTIVDSQRDLIEKFIVKIFSQGENRNHTERLSIELAFFCLQVRVQLHCANLKNTRARSHHLKTETMKNWT